MAPTPNPKSKKELLEVINALENEKNVSKTNDQVQKMAMRVVTELELKNPTFTKEQWEKRGGKNYVRGISPSYQQMYDELAEIILLENPKHVLEFGCGYGYFLKKLFDKSKLIKAKSMWGCDFSSTQVNQAKTYFSEANFIQADIAEPIPLFNDICFDIMVGVSVLMYLNENGLNNFLRQVKNSCTGKIYIVENYYKYLSREKQNAYLKVMPSDGRKIYDYEQLLENNGIKFLETRQFEGMTNPKINTLNEMPMSLTIGKV